MKQLLTIALFTTLVLSMNYSDDYKAQIARKSDDAWEDLMQNSRDGFLIDPPLNAKTINANFGQYKDALMLFPDFSFDDFVTDRRLGDKYYYSFDANDGLFVIKYDNRITDMLREYSYAMGPVGNANWELLGQIKEAYDWWGDVVLMEIKAVRVRGKASVIREGNDLIFPAKDLIDAFMDEKASAGTGDIPLNLTSIPSGLDPRTVAELYFQIASREHNRDVWTDLLSSNNFYRGKPERRVDTWWNNLNKDGRTFFYVRTATDEDTTKKYFYQIRENGNDIGSPKPITLVLEDNEWKVKSGI